MAKTRSCRTDIPTPTKTSPYNLLQEQLWRDPWKLLVACTMLNRTHNRQVKEIIWKFFELFPDNETFLEKNKFEREYEVKKFIAPLGFKNKRFETLWNMSHDLYEKKSIEQVYGMGKYALDSYDMFVGRYLVEGATDKKLKLYVDWAKKEAEGRDVSGRIGASLSPSELISVPPVKRAQEGFASVAQEQDSGKQSP